MRNRINISDEELLKMFDLITAVFDLQIEACKKENLGQEIIEHTQELKAQAEVLYLQKNQKKLKQWFYDTVEEAVIEAPEVGLILERKTGYKIEILEKFHKRIEKLLEKGRITTLKQYAEVNLLINNLCQTNPIDTPMIEKLNKLLSTYTLAHRAP